MRQRNPVQASEERPLRRSEGLPNSSPSFQSLDLLLSLSTDDDEHDVSLSSMLYRSYFSISIPSSLKL